MDHALETSLLFRPRHGEMRDAVVRLAASATFTRALRAGACIAVQSGRVWLTQTGDANDYFVDAGQRHVIVRGGRVVIEGCGPQATFRLLSAAPAARPGFP
jgi:Protein of unknown function (DUF2917)